MPIRREGVDKAVIMCCILDPKRLASSTSSVCVYYSACMCTKEVHMYAYAMPWSTSADKLQIVEQEI
jgi:hypothetical protein